MSDVNDIIEWNDGSGAHRWRVRGIHLGAVGVESVVELENVSHQPAWTGEWETHRLMFVPECLLLACKVVRPEPALRQFDAMSDELPKPETLLAYASILEKPQYWIDPRGRKWLLATGEIIETACAALRYCAALKSKSEG